MVKFKYFEGIWRFCGGVGQAVNKNISCRFAQRLQRNKNVNEMKVAKGENWVDGGVDR